MCAGIYGVWVWEGQLIIYKVVFPIFWCMITGVLRNKIDGLWEIFWTGGLTNPLDVIEQITYLMFVRDLDEADDRRFEEQSFLGISYESVFAGTVRIGDRVEDAAILKWSHFRDLPAGEMYEVVQSGVFPFIKSLDPDKESAYSRYMSDAIFKVPTPAKLTQIVDALDEIYSLMRKGDRDDTKGDVYEYLLSKISTSGTNGQFRTPRHIIRMMVELMSPKPGEVICDPACGTAGFLVAAGEFLRERYLSEIFYDKDQSRHYHEVMFSGYDMDRTMLRIGAMNMMTHGVRSPHIEYRDSLSEQNQDAGKFSLILTNPPFKGSLDFDGVSPDLLSVARTKKTELLFLVLFLRMLRVGGRCAAIVPDGVLFGSSAAHKAVRQELVERNRLEAVISMPSGVFKPYAGVSTAIVIFTKTGYGGTDSVWMYDMEADGFSLDDKRTPVAENDIPDIVSRFSDLSNEIGRARTEKSFCVPKDEIAANGYDLSVNKYREVVYEAEVFPPTSEILADIRETEKRILRGIDELERMI